MRPPVFSNLAESGKYRIPFLIALITAGLAGNYYNFEIFLNINFLFGSVFAMLALQSFGLRRGIIAAACIASYTYFLWNHPYAIIVQTAEVAVVGLLIERRKMGLVLADTLFWLIIGMPLVYLCYHFVMHVPPSNTHIVMFKQAVNGIANALVARLIFTGYALWVRSSLISLRDIIYDLLTFFVLIPALILLAVGSRTDFNETDHQIRASLIWESLDVTQSLNTWVKNRKAVILTLADLSASRSPRQLQASLEQAVRSDINFNRIGLLNKDAISIAYYPQIDELGQSNLGKNYADRPYISLLKTTLRPMLSEVVVGKIGSRKPNVLMIVPVVIEGKYGGYVAGTLGLNQILDYLGKKLEGHTAFFTLLDKNGNVIMTNRKDQTVMTPFMRDKGALHCLDKRISQWGA